MSGKEHAIKLKDKCDLCHGPWPKDVDGHPVIGLSITSKFEDVDFAAHFKCLEEALIGGFAHYRATSAAESVDIEITNTGEER